MSTKAQKSEKRNQNKKKTCVKKDMADVLPRRVQTKRGRKRKEHKNTYKFASICFMRFSSEKGK